MTKHLAANGLTLLIVTMVAVWSIMGWGRMQFTAPGPLAEDTVIEVPPNAGLNTVTSRLKEAGAISQPFIFSTMARMRGDDERLKLGCYRIGAGATMEEILGRVTSGAGSSACYQATFVLNARGTEVRISNAVAPESSDNGRFELAEGLERIAAQRDSGEPVNFRVAVAEGLTSREVVEGLRAIPVLEGELADVPPEGQLAPDTFDISAGTTLPGLVERMVSLQAQRLQEAWDERDQDLPLSSPEELLTLASIVEKETGVPEERGVVSAVFVNRLRQGMLLQTDPTIVYGITRGQEALGREISRSDISGETERQRHGDVVYNTYVIEGLPPGPIANPGRAAIRAAASPDESPYLFFVADGTGGHAFAETLAGHNENVARYRALQNAN